MGHDVYHSRGKPALVLLPTSVEMLCAAVKACVQQGVAMVPRGGGASYTDGYLLAGEDHVLIDTGALDMIEVDEANALVRVGAGVTWAKLRDALAAKGLRTPFWGPFSGLVATVGGSVSQNTISHGSGGYGISAQSVVSMDVVLASGVLITTAPSRATRNYGPDLTGLFTGDCGAFGIKATVSLPLLAAGSHFETLSFAFPTFEAYHAGVGAAARAGLDDEHFGLDLALSQGQIGKQNGIVSRLNIARQVLRSTPGMVAGLLQLLKMARSGEAALTASAFMCHFIIEGASGAEVAGKADSLRALIASKGREIANSVPTFVRAVPFAPLTNILGPKGERWVPVHGIVRHTDAVPLHNAISAYFAELREEFERLGIWSGVMFSSVGSTGFLYEVALYWRDAQTDYHRATLDPAFREGTPAYPADAAAAAVIERTKAELIAIYARHGAAHFQIGRSYPYLDRLDPQARTLLLAVKAQLDPDNLMNPGVLGLPA